MTTPDPITTARRKTIEMSEELYEFYPAMSAQNHAYEVRKYVAQVTAPLLAELKKLKAERDELKAAKWDVKHVDTMNDMVSMRLARDAAEAEITRLTSQLEQAERVIKPFAEFVDCLDEELPDDEEYNTELGLDGYHSLTCGNFRDASQWIKDRQAKGEGS